jgi:hypothetical protein
MKKFDEPRMGNEALDLEFPEWSGMRDSSELVSAGRALALSEEYAVLFPEAMRKRQQEKWDKCAVEFVL